MQFVELAPFQPAVAAIPARAYCVPKVPTVGGGGVSTGGPRPDPGNSNGDKPQCPIILFVPPCTTNPLTGRPVCTPRVISC